MHLIIHELERRVRVRLEANQAKLRDKKWHKRQRKDVKNLVCFFHLNRKWLKRFQDGKPLSQHIGFALTRDEVQTLCNEMLEILKRSKKKR